MLGGNNISARAVRGSPALLAAGFTLVELLIAMAVFAIVVAMAMPSLTSVVNNNRLATQANSLIADVQLARSEAVRRNRTVRLCRTTDGTTCAAAVGDWSRWLVVVPAATPEILRDFTPKAPMEVTADVANVDFRSDGLARNSTGGLLATNFTVCIPTALPPQNIRTVSMVGGSRLNAVAGAHSTPGSCP